MFRPILVAWTVCHLLISLALALTLPPIEDYTIVTPPPPATNKPYPNSAALTLDSPALESNTSRALTLPDPVCNGTLLGYNMNRYSCLQAWNTIPTGTAPVSFGDRAHGFFEVPLPRRFSGRECDVFFFFFFFFFFFGRRGHLAPPFLNWRGRMLMKKKRTGLVSSMFSTRVAPSPIRRPGSRSSERRSFCTGGALLSEASGHREAGSENWVCFWCSVQAALVNIQLSPSQHYPLIFCLVKRPKPQAGCSLERLSTGGLLFWPTLRTKAAGYRPATVARCRPRQY